MTRSILGTRARSAAKIRLSCSGCLFFEVLDDVGEVLSTLGQSLLGPGFGLAASAVGRQVGHMPPGDECAESSDARMFPKLPERVDGQEVSELSASIHPLVLFVGHLAADCLAIALAVLKKPNGAP